MSNISDLWGRLHAWAQTHAPAMTEDLASPASESEIAEVEAELGANLPESLKDSLKIHNGETDGWPCKVFADRGAYLSTQRIIEEWKSRRTITIDSDEIEDPESLIRDNVISVHGPVTPVMFDESWVPIMESNGDVFWALDFSPAPGGTAGQIIEVDWESCSWSVIAESFEQFLEQYVDDLEAGSYKLHGGLLTQADESWVALADKLATRTPKRGCGPIGWAAAIVFGSLVAYWILK